MTARRCARCHGNLFPDDGAWTCLQCGRTARLVPVTVLPFLDEARDRSSRRKQSISNVQKVEAYVQAFEGRTAKEMAEALEVDDSEVRKVLLRLMDEGVVERRGDGKPFRWFIAGIQEESA